MAKDEYVKDSEEGRFKIFKSLGLYLLLYSLLFYAKQLSSIAN